LANILTIVAYGKESFILTRLGEVFASIILMTAFNRHSNGWIPNPWGCQTGRE